MSKRKKVIGICKVSLFCSKIILVSELFNFLKKDFVMKKIALCIMLTSMYQLSASFTPQGQTSDRDALIIVYGQETAREVADQYQQFDAIADINFDEDTQKAIAESLQESSITASAPIAFAAPARATSSVSRSMFTASSSSSSSSSLPEGDDYNEDEALRQAIAESLKDVRK